MNFKSIIYFLRNPSLILPQIKFNSYLKKNPDVPWITPSAVNFLNDNLSKNDFVFEWGSGRSTTWIARRVGKVVSIEDNPSWFDKVNLKLKDNEISNVEYLLINKNNDDEKKFSNQLLANEKNIAPAYVDIINKFENKFNLVVVDGSFRHICVKNALDKITNGGYLLIDNSNWTDLSKWGVPATWKIVHNSNIRVNQTTIWQKVA